MTLLLFVAAGLALGLVRGGRPSRIAQDRTRWLWLPITAFALKQVAAMLVPGSHLPVVPVQVCVCLVQYGLLLAFAWANRRAGGWAWAFGAGTAANFLVILFNGGAMPVSARLLASPGGAALAQSLAVGEVFAYTLCGPGTRLAFLGDVLAFMPGGRLAGFASAGDLALGLGAGWLACRMMGPRPLPFQKANKSA